MSSTSIKALAMVQEEVLKLEKQVADMNLAKQGVQTDGDENYKVCKGLENVKVEVENVKVEIKELKNQISVDMSKLTKALEKFEVLIKKTPRPYSCFGCSKGFICLDGKPVAGCPLDNAMVTAKSDFMSGGDLVHAGDTGIGYYAPIGNVSKYTIIWENAGIHSHSFYDCSNMVYKCGANRQ